MDELLFLRFIANILTIRAECIPTNGRKDSLSAFEKECCFHATLQPMYTASSLEYLLTNTQPDTFYEITDYLNTSLMFFQFEGSQYLIGPYVKSTFSHAEMQTLLAAHKLPASLFLPLKLYYDRFPQLSYGMISGTVQAAMRTFFPSTPDYACRKLTGFHEELKREELVTRSSETYMQILMRYEMENFLLRKISEGDVEGVKLSFESMTSNFYTSTDSAQQSVYISNSTGLATIRALARKAAEQGGCPIVKIDEITQENIQKASSIRRLGELDLLVKELLIRLTMAVAEAKDLKAYSPVVRDIVSYIHTNYTDSISLGELARARHVSPEYLSRAFKKETGQTLTDRLAELRTKKAAELLRNSQLSVSEIAAFVGYPDSNYFVKVFKKRYGMTPSAYR